MAAIPAGVLGSQTIAAFQIGKFEVTKAEYRAFVRDTNYREVNPHCFKFGGPDGIIRGNETWENPPYQDTDAHPVVCVSDDDAAAYVRWLAQKTGKPYRLPSAAEWQLAGNGGAAMLYSGTREQICRVGNMGDQTGGPASAALRGFANAPVFPCLDGAIFPTVVGMYEPNAYGVYDMIGNVAEMVADCVHDSIPAGVTPPTDGSAWVTNCTSNFRRELGSSFYVGELDNFDWRVSMGSRGIVEGFRVALRAPVTPASPETVAFEATLEQARVAERARRAAGQFR